MNREEQRFQAAAMAMQSIVLNPRWDKCHWDVIAEASVDAADCLLEALSLYPVVRESLTTPDAYGGWRPCPTCGKPVVNNPPAWGFPKMGGEHHSGDVTEKVPDADGWIEHRPGDAMPCDASMEVRVKYRDGVTGLDDAGNLQKSPNFWGNECSPDCRIIAWRPAK